ncbi:hypothetical protein IAD21_04343 [Abditibacteriota bacterium]|nr:hypothetical protein IAD21_04343 [Abditibacteriota bacterium]
MLPIILCLVALSLICASISLMMVLKLVRTIEKTGDVSLVTRCESLETGQKRLEEILRSEIAQNRREIFDSLGNNRDVLTGQVIGVTESINTLKSALQNALVDAFSKQRDAQAIESKKMRDEAAEVIKAQGELLLVQHYSALEKQTTLLQDIEVRLQKSQSESGQLRDNIVKALDAIRLGLPEKMQEIAAKQREEHATAAKLARDEATLVLQARGEALHGQLKTLADTQLERLTDIRLSLEKAQTEAGQLRDNVVKALDALKMGLIEKIAASAQFHRDGHANDARLARDEAALSIKNQGEALLAQVTVTYETQKEFLATLVRNHKTEANSLTEGLQRALANINTLLSEQNATIAKGQAEQTRVIAQGQTDQITAVTQSLDGFSDKVRQFEGKTETTLEKMREGVEKRLADLQTGNEQKLEEMRRTVDEKLHDTLEKRLGESFSRVLEGLVQVQRGLGEMKELANGVGDLKKVLSNVKTRGNWGEVQLGNLLEQIMAPAQYEKNVAVTNGRERVEFAIKLPGRDDSQNQVWLPIDAKFPQESYARLVTAEEAGDLEARDKASKELEEVVKKCAGEISKKYISPPLTTDFALLYLPTEGLYAEVVKRTSVVEHLHRECRVVVAGPTTVAALLNSLQMGFRTLEIQKSSSKINDVLISVKTEFGKYAVVLEKIKKNLDTAQNTVEDAQRRTRVITRTLDKVEVLENAPKSANLVLSAAEPVVEALDLEMLETK